MAASFYMDVHVPLIVTDALRRHGISVVRSQEDGSSGWPDERLLERATKLQRVLVTQDEDFLGIAQIWQAAGRSFEGIIYSHQLKISIGDLINDLTLISAVCLPADYQNRVIFLPL